MTKLPFKPGRFVTATASIFSIGTFSNTSFTTFGNAWAWRFMATVGITPPNLLWDCFNNDSAKTFLVFGLKDLRRYINISKKYKEKSRMDI